MLAMGVIAASSLGVTTLVAPAAPNDNTTSLVQANGTEPFWGVKITRRGIEYSSLGADKLMFPYVEPLQAEGRPASAARVYHLKNQSVDGLLMINKTATGFCNDGMSDNQYPFTSMLLINDKIYVGCASTLEDPMVPTAAP